MRDDMTVIATACPFSRGNSAVVPVQLPCWPRRRRRRAAPGLAV